MMSITTVFLTLKTVALSRINPVSIKAPGIRKTLQHAVCLVSVQQNSPQGKEQNGKSSISCIFGAKLTYSLGNPGERNLAELFEV